MMDDLDRSLAANYRNDPDADIVPSSGFARAVLDTVRAAHVAPPPIPFPWTRALLSLAAVGLTLVVSAAAVIREVGRSSGDGWSVPVPPAVRATLLGATTTESIWTITALFLATASIVAAMRAGQWLHRR